ncbi:MAG: ABC transporter substrate-binding protein, partial [Armatimonadetes bacterium]|nr:ABC transporter substrate-binding protein [Armatimonadota bacterium]
NKLVRQAMNYAVDKDAIIRSILQGYGRKLEGQLLSPEYFGYNPALKAYPYDAEKAKQLLAQAGYPNGFSITMHSPAGRYPLDKEVTQAIAGYLERVGIRAQVRVIEWTTYLRMLFSKDLSPAGFIGMAVQPEGAIMLSIQQTGNISSYNANREFDQVLLEASKTFDPERRKRLYVRATQILYDDPPGIFLYQQFDIYGAGKKVVGWKPRPDQLIDLAGVYLSN